MRENLARRAVPITAVICALLVIVVVLRFSNALAVQPRTERQYFPVDAVNFIERQGLRGPIFNRYDWGGYLLWKLYPRERVFIDGRSDVYGLTDDFLFREYSRIYEGGGDWSSALAQLNIRLVLVDSQAPIAQLLRQDPRWSRAYSDELAVVYTRK